MLRAISQGRKIATRSTDVTRLLCWTFVRWLFWAISKDQLQSDKLWFVSDLIWMCVCGFYKLYCDCLLLRLMQINKYLIIEHQCVFTQSMSSDMTMRRARRNSIFIVEYWCFVRRACVIGSRPCRKWLNTICAHMLKQTPSQSALYFYLRAIITSYIRDQRYICAKANGHTLIKQFSSTWNE